MYNPKQHLYSRKNCTIVSSQCPKNPEPKKNPTTTKTSAENVNVG